MRLIWRVTSSCRLVRPFRRRKKKAKQEAQGSSFTQTVLLHAVRSMDSKHAPGSALIWRLLVLNASNGLTPDIPKIAISASCPTRGTGVLDIQSTVQGHAMRGGLVNDRLRIHLPGGRLKPALSGEEHRMSVRITSRIDRVGKESGEKSEEGGGIEIPLAKEAGDALVKGDHVS